jgi:pseudouridine synthase, rluA family
MTKVKKIKKQRVKMEKENKITVMVTFDEINERMDSFLSRKTDFTRSRIQQLIKNGDITVNGKNAKNNKKIKSSYKIEENDRIEIFIPETEQAEIIPENIKIDIIYEDEDIAVINKNAGLVVHPAQGHYSGTLVNAILYHIKDLSGINGEIRPGIVHRLDKDTSGLIVIAKNDKAHINLAKMFQEKKIKKTYLAILKGKLTKEKGRIVTQIGRDTDDRKKMTVIKGNDRGKEAITNYNVICSNELFTLVKVYIETGRTHQIRVHMKYMGYPILGDMVYGRKDSEKRQMLHAYKLEFLHPVTEKPMKFISEIPEDFRKALKNIKLEFDLNDL